MRRGRMRGGRGECRCRGSVPCRRHGDTRNRRNAHNRRCDGTRHTPRAARKAIVVRTHTGTLAPRKPTGHDYCSGFLGAEGEVEGVGGAVEGEEVGGGGEGGEYARFGCVEGFGGEVGRPCGAGECEEGAESAAVESRKIFLDYLGTEILGLNSTAYNLLQFLNIAELGIGSAIGSTLYKPLFEKDKQSISEIIALQGKFYQRIAIFIIAGAAAIMPFFPLIFKKMTLPLWYAYASFAALLFSALLSYFVNYKQILLSADQKEYKIQYTYRLSMMVKVAVQMLAIITLPNGYIWWLILEINLTEKEQKKKLYGKRPA